MWQQIGRTVKRAGKFFGSQALIDKGRQWQYGHLSPDQLLKQHPSAFLRKYAIQSKLENPDKPNTDAPASLNQTHQLRTGGTTAPNFLGLSHITGSDGVRRPAAGYFHLVQDTQAATHAQTFESHQVGANVQAAFLPMRQVARNDFGGDLQNTKTQVPDWKNGRVRVRDMVGANEDTIFTTQLSGCTIAKRRDNMLHLRPSETGDEMQGSLPRPNTFGSLDYGAGWGREAFVMMRHKPNGNVRLYYQKHDVNTGEMSSGRMDFPTI